MIEQAISAVRWTQGSNRGAVRMRQRSPRVCTATPLIVRLFLWSTRNNAQ